MNQSTVLDSLITERTRSLHLSLRANAARPKFADFLDSIKNSTCVFLRGGASLSRPRQWKTFILDRCWRAYILFILKSDAEWAHTGKIRFPHSPNWVLQSLAFPHMNIPGMRTTSIRVVIYRSSARCRGEAQSRRSNPLQSSRSSQAVQDIWSQRTFSWTRRIPNVNKKP